MKGGLVKGTGFVSVRGCYRRGCNESGGVVKGTGGVMGGVVMRGTS